ncbi:AMP-binding protein [Euzebya tangerina]|uniref:AMP-binding protein n=1 Tax=Euzebya tangerina TaxID=591198 RepID=UPI000E311CD9|nr:AMP-binding protein [Euzebya tangerina]
MFGLPTLSPRDLGAGVTALVRAGVIRPLLPTPSLIGLALEFPLVRPNLGFAIAFQAVTQPAEVAVVDDDGLLTWRELDLRVTRLSNVLLDHGAAGGCAAFMLRNGRAAIEAYAAGGRSGLAPVPLNTWATASEIARILHMQRPAVLIVDLEFAELARTAVADLDEPPAIITVGERGTYETVLAAASSNAPFSRGTGKVVIHTSGTTGAPKGAERTVGSSQLGALLGFVSKIPLRRADKLLVAPPLFHAFASGAVGAACLIGTTIVLSRSFDPASFEADVRRHEITAAALVPVMVRRVLQHDPPAPSSGLRLLLTSGSAFSEGLRDAAQARWGEITYDLYGSTEAGWVSISTPEDFATRRGTVGKPGFGIRVRVADSNGTPLPPGEIGALEVQTGMEFSGYTGSDGHRGAWQIGDLGYLDDDGYLYVTGRRDEMVISGGENIYPSEVEGMLDTHPDVIESAVIGVDDEEYGQVLWAYVAGDLDTDTLAPWLRDRLSRYKVPKRFIHLDELPRNATGKLLKRKLRQAEHPSCQT